MLRGFGAWDETAAAASGLLQGGGHVGVLALGLDCAEGGEPDEEGVVGGAALGGPLRDGQVLALLRTRTGRVPEGCGVDRPPRLAQLAVDQLAGIGLIELNGGGGGVARADERGDARLGLLCGMRLQRRQLRGQGRLGVLRLLGQLLPESLLVLGRSELRLHGLKLLDRILTCSSVFGEFIGEALQLGAHVSGSGGGSLGRDEGARLVRRILDRAVEPDTKLPSDLQRREGGTVIPRQRMARRVASAPHLAKELSDIPRDDPVVLQPTDELVLGLLGRKEKPHLGRDVLREQLRQLA